MTDPTVIDFDYEEAFILECAEHEKTRHHMLDLKADIREFEERNTILEKSELWTRQDGAAYREKIEELETELEEWRSGKCKYRVRQD